MLRCVGRGDAKALFDLYSHAEVMKYRGADTFSLVSEAEELIRHFEAQFKTKEGIRWVIAWKGKEEELIGTIGLKTIDWKNFRAEIGYELSPLLWNKNIMTEALGCIAEYCFAKLNLHTLEANIAPDHFASARVLQKTGFVKEAHYKENWYYKGWWDSDIYTLHASDTPSTSCQVVCG